MISALSPRERAVGRYLLGGWSYESIAYQLDISPLTAKAYGQRVIAATGEHNVIRAVLSILRCRESLDLVMEHPTYEP
jgi:DNA-binding NarL/FixJ family response regulator